MKNIDSEKKLSLVQIEHLAITLLYVSECVKNSVTRTLWTPIDFVYEGLRQCTCPVMRVNYRCPSSLLYSANLPLYPLKG
jgi:hypothetical protein